MASKTVKTCDACTEVVNDFQGCRVEIQEHGPYSSRLFQKQSQVLDLCDDCWEGIQQHFRWADIASLR
jgi:hypothetical protein